MPRFALLSHRMPVGSSRPDHFDLLLEHAGACRTWALAADPSRSEPIEADSLADHRLRYLEYEGPISDRRGTVSQFDAGEFQWHVDEHERVEIAVEGRLLRGTILLTRRSVDSAHWQYQYLSNAAIDRGKDL